jgi:uncharacterized membrane protein YbaN (DUF454 family)
VEQVGKVELDPEMRGRASRGTRLILLAGGHLCLGLGLVGLVVPVMPTTIFLIGAAACYARASATLHRWLLGHRVFGPVLADWQVHRAMSVRSKVAATGAIVLAFGVTLAVAVEPPWLRAVVVTLGALLVAGILSIRTRRA